MTAGKPRVASLDTPLNVALINADYSLDDLPYAPVRLPVKDGPDLRFRGAEIASQAPGNLGARWGELILWRVEGGGFVAANGWHSNVPGEETFWRAEPVATVREAMAVWGWTPIAKSFAKRLRWDVAIHLGRAEP